MWTNARADKDLLPPPVAPTPKRDRPSSEAEVFERLLGAAAWGRLHPDIRYRFGAAVAGGRETHYGGVMGIVRASRLGRILAQACRLIGTPLAPHVGERVPVLARVYHDEKRGGMTWERLYSFPGKAPVRVASTKIYNPRRGLLEVVQGGLGMRLAVYERDAALHFESQDYFWGLGLGRWGTVFLPLPTWLTPGRIHVVHADVGAGRFRFALEARHPWFGETFFQEGVFAALAEA